MKLLLISIVCLIGELCNAQTPINIGNSYNFYSETLKEKRPYRISLPQSYADAKYAAAAYPVLYVLDGEMAFDYYVAISKFLSKGVYASIPEMIIVGIDNTDRTRDMTPTKASIPSPDDRTKLLFTNSGGGENFTNFLKKEFIPFIDSTYRCNGYRILAGHSFGGLAATNILLHQSQLFNAYLIHDPSLWWDNQYTLKQTLQFLPQLHLKKARVYLSQANNDEKGAFDEQFESIKKFKQICDSISNAELALQYQFYEKEDHGTLPLPAAYDGLKYIFDGYQINFKHIDLDKNLLIKSYKKFSDKMGVEFKPSEQMLRFMIKYFKENNKYDDAQVVRQQYKYFYPNATYKID